MRTAGSCCASTTSLFPPERSLCVFCLVCVGANQEQQPKEASEPARRASLRPVGNKTTFNLQAAGVSEKVKSRC